jgi:hypothetical protein
VKYKHKIVTKKETDWRGNVIGKREQKNINKRKHVLSSLIIWDQDQPVNRKKSICS